VVIMAWLSLLGLLALYRTVEKAFGHNAWPLRVAVFLVPSVLFYGSGLHKEALAITGLGFLLYGFSSLFNNQTLVRSWLFFLLGALIIYLVREFILIALIPAMAGYFWVRLSPGKPLLKFISAQLIFWILFFSLHYVFPAWDPAGTMAVRQHEFLVLKGRSSFPAPPLRPDTWSVILEIPSGLIHSILMPFPWQIRSTGMLLYFLENLFIVFLFLRLLLRPARLPDSARFMGWMLVSYSLAVHAIIGIIVPNLGAISRYRTPALLCLVIFLALANQWPPNWLRQKKLFFHGPAKGIL